MKTTVLMKRELFGAEISQNNQNCFFSATDLVRAGNKWRITNNLPMFDLKTFFQLKSTKEFMEFLSAQYGVIKINAKGKNQHTWVHPFLFIEIALAISPKLKIEVYSWLYDSLIKYRNESGDSYKRMCGALYITQSNKSLFADDMKVLANRIKLECNVEDWNRATQEQLELRNRIHNNIAILSDILKDRENLYNVAIKKAKQGL
ncbi:MAG: KilA-N domain-containing protein [Spirochaetaceae bacterium]|nr:KilA-N domain-containing protein [Spirochaetaceae bacterium]MBO7731856.1 KilA-N domain-containing protein [Methanobrevibacter sp.]